MITNADLVEQAEIEWLKQNLSKLDFETALKQYESLYNHARKLAPKLFIKEASDDAQLLKSEKIDIIRRMSRIFQSVGARRRRAPTNRNV